MHAAVAADGSVLVGFCGENSPGGGINRGIGISRASHPLGPFQKDTTPVASPTGICGGKGRCDDVIMQSIRRGTTDEIHIYYSVKGSDCHNDGIGDCIHHRLSTDAGKTWGPSLKVIQRSPKQGTACEPIAGKYFPRINGGKGGMMLLPDGGPGQSLTPFVAPSMEFDQGFMPTTPSELLEHPPGGKGQAPKKGEWAASEQIAFIPDSKGDVVGVAYTVWNGVPVQVGKKTSMGYSMVVYRFATPPSAIAGPDRGAS